MSFTALELLFTTPPFHLGLIYTSHSPTSTAIVFQAATRARIDFGRIAAAMSRAARDMLLLQVGISEMNHTNVATRATSRASV